MQYIAYKLTNTDVFLFQEHIQVVSYIQIQDWSQRLKSSENNDIVYDFVSELSFKHSLFMTNWVS